MINFEECSKCATCEDCYQFDLCKEEQRIEELKNNAISKSEVQNSNILIFVEPNECKNISACICGSVEVNEEVGILPDDHSKWYQVKCGQCGLKSPFTTDISLARLLFYFVVNQANKFEKMVYKAENIVKTIISDLDNKKAKIKKVNKIKE